MQLELEVAISNKVVGMKSALVVSRCVSREGGQPR